jgi:hypothetical protein
VESCQWHPTLQDKRDEGVAEGRPGESFSCVVVDLAEVVEVAFRPLSKSCFDQRLEGTISPKVIAKGFPLPPVGEEQIALGRGLRVLPRLIVVRHNWY